MRSKADVVIAGAGVIGLMAAWFLHRRGVRVTVLDSGVPGRQASWAGGGVLWPIGPWRYPEPVQRMAMRGAELYPELSADLVRRTGVDPEWCQSGVLLLEPADQEAAVAWANEHGWRYETLSAASLAQRLPGVKNDVGAVYMPDIAQIRNPRLCRALAVALRGEGVSVQENTFVQEVVCTGDVFTGFRTNQGLIEGDNGVIATGAWSSRIAGVPELPPVEPVKGEMLLFETSPGRFPYIMIAGSQYVIPRVDGRVLVGSTVSRSGFDQIPTRAGHDALLAAAAHLAPELAEQSLVAQWAGLRPATPDAEPFVGPVPHRRGLFASVGHFRNGLAHAPAAAEMLAARIQQA